MAALLVGMSVMAVLLGAALPVWNKQAQRERDGAEHRLLPHAGEQRHLAPVDFRPLRAKPTDTDVTVNVRVLQSGQQPVQIDCVEERNQTRHWKRKSLLVSATMGSLGSTSRIRITLSIIVISCTSTTRRTSSSRPMTGSSLSLLACSVRSRPKRSSAW